MIQTKSDFLSGNSIQKINVGAKPLYRLRSDRIILGICSGIARKLGISSTVSRLIFSALTLFSGGGLIIVYIIAFLLIPQEPIE
ncbi:MAG: PspC domain-containing protein [Euryarchaeota archaeon]|nr:PspC domain-containing protein [Euryarchaeota archaeon]HII13036.1 PspC domain-containing protein [Candidatus Thalassarchaeaceae archaeon]MBT4156524.1 PspC domain-containing protein [Euryarchaeota archaeon]MBT4180464.1 PspC domain-containing protein [Euryarchaeota archaeon]MBT4474961.1 PspC domain-containing protein [Euryarchaeota archaeon]